MNWFDEYKMLLFDEKEYYKDNLYDDEQRAIVLNYDRFVESLKYVAQNPLKLKQHMNKKLNIAEEVALSFENEALYISNILYNMKLIDKDIMQLLQQINVLFEEIKQENDDWSEEYMIKNVKWQRIRNIANEILLMLNETLT